MSNLLSNIEHDGCFGKMKIEDGKLVFACIHPPPPPSPSSCDYTLVPPPPYSPPCQVPPPPSAPPLVKDDWNIDELKDELKETKERLVKLEEQMKDMHRMNWRISRTELQIDHLYRCRRAVFMPGNKLGGAAGDLYDFNSEELYITSIADTYNVNINKKVFLPYILLEERLNILFFQLRLESLSNIVIQPNQSSIGVGQLITPNCVHIIRFILRLARRAGGVMPERYPQITISNPTGTLATGFVVSLCEQLNPDSRVTIVITQARISEQNEIKNKVDKDLFDKIKFEKVVSSA